MGFDDIHNTGLVLGLGLSSDVHRHDQFEKRSEPSLTLTLSADQSIGHVYLQPQDSGGVSSPCRGSLKRERMASRFCNEDDDDSNGRKKLRLTKAQSALLEESFKAHSTLNPKHKQELAKELKLRPRQVEVWFQNRRARTKLKKTEVDCEQLKKCFETLTEENRMLQKELQKLKSLNFPPPLYMKLPAATLTMCPSCERVGGATAGVGDNGSKSKPHFYNPLTNPSTAC